MLNTSSVRTASCNLLLGDVGRHYSELAASWLWVVTLGGVVLWLRRQRGRANKVRATVLPDLSAKKGCAAPGAGTPSPE